MHNSVKSLKSLITLMHKSRTGLVVPLAQQEAVQLLATEALHRHCADDTALRGPAAQAAAPPQKGPGHQVPLISPSLRARRTQHVGLSPDSITRIYQRNGIPDSITRTAAIDISELSTLTTSTTVKMNTSQNSRNSHIQGRSDGI